MALDLALAKDLAIWISEIDAHIANGIHFCDIESEQLKFTPIRELLERMFLAKEPIDYDVAQTMLKTVPGVDGSSTEENMLCPAKPKKDAKLRQALAVLAMVFHHDVEAAFMFKFANPGGLAKNTGAVLKEAIRLEKCAKDVNKQFLSRCIAATIAILRSTQWAALTDEERSKESTLRKVVEKFANDATVLGWFHWDCRDELGLVIILGHDLEDEEKRANQQKQRAWLYEKVVTGMMFIYRELLNPCTAAPGLKIKKPLRWKKLSEQWIRESKKKLKARKKMSLGDLIINKEFRVVKRQLKCVDKSAAKKSKSWDLGNLGGTAPRLVV